MQQIGFEVKTVFHNLFFFTLIKLCLFFLSFFIIISWSFFSPPTLFHFNKLFSFQIDKMFYNKA